MDSSEKPSKSALKRRMLELQAMGEKLVALPASRLAKIPMPDRLREAVMAARGMNKRGALHRQRQYIGRVMREIDAEPVAAALARLEAKEATSAAQFRHIEHWRDRLIGEGDAAITELLDNVKGADVPHLRALVRNARKEREREATPVKARELFRYLRGLLGDDGGAG